jgi:hypothetical protein
MKLMNRILVVSRVDWDKLHASKYNVVRIVEAFFIIEPDGSITTEKAPGNPTSTTMKLMNKTQLAEIKQKLTYIEVPD